MTVLKRIAVLAALAVASAAAFVKDAFTGAHDNVLVPFMNGAGLMPTMVLLGRSYKGYAAGTIVKLATNEEASLIAQGLATNSAGPVTPGAVTTTATAGRVGIAAGQSSVVVTNPLVDANSVIFAVINQAAADGTLLRVERVVPAAGSFTIFGTANATAAVTIDWILHMVSGELPPTNT